MKKILVVLGLLVSTNCYAGTISIQPFISGNDVTIPRLETQRQTLQNVINGGLEGGGQNIRAGSITSSDLATAINPVTFRNEAFNDWTYSGMLPPTSASLSSTTTAGVSYVSGVRVETAATAHTYTASKDTYVYINMGGYFNYDEVANGASAPSNYSSSNGNLLLCKVVTDGTTINTVTDLRTTSIQITANNSNFATNYRDQAFVSRDTTVNFYVKPGSFAIGSSNYTNTAVTTTKSIVTGANWIEGGYPSGYIGNVFIYGYNNSGTAFDFKFSSADVAYADTSLNTGGVKRYYVSGGTTYRAIGWAHLSADVVQLYNTSNFKDVATPNAVYRTSSTVYTTASSTGDTDPHSEVKFYSTGGTVRITYSIAGSSGSSDNISAMISVDGKAITETERMVKTDTTTTRGFSAVPQWQGILSQGLHTIKGVVFIDAGGTATINRRSIIVEEI